MLVMKYNFELINSHIPPKKCGIDPVSALIAPGIGLVGSIGSAIIGAESADSAMSSNIAENQKNRDFQSREAEIARKWQEQFWQNQFTQQTGEWYNQADYNAAEWNRQFGMQSKEWQRQQDYANSQSYQYWLKQQQYNTPSEMVGRAYAAGFNPSTGVGLGTFGSTGMSAAPVGASVSPNVAGHSVAQPSTPSTSVPSGSSMQVASPSNFADSFSHVIGGVSDLMKALASSRKDNAEANQSEKMLSGMLQEQLLNIHNKQLVNSYQEAYNVFFSKKAPKELQQLGANVDKILAERLLTDATTDKVMNESVTETFKQLLLDNQSKLAHADFMKALIVVDNLDQQLKAEIKLRRAQTSQAYATAGAQSAMARLAVANAENQEFWNGLNGEQRDQYSQQIVLETERMCASLGLETSQAEVAKQMALKIGKDVSFYEARFWNEAIQSYIRTGTDVFGEFTKYKAFRELGAMRQEQIKNQMRGLELEERKLNQKPYNKRHERYNADGDLIGYDFTAFE